MKKCNNCGAHIGDSANFCAICGSDDLDLIIGNSIKSQASEADENVAVKRTGNGDILPGIVGSFLFSLIGGLLYFAIFQIDVVFGICGLIIFVLACFGYDIFAKTKNKVSVVGFITAIVATVIMILLAEYVCLSFEVFEAYKDTGISFAQAFFGAYDFLSDPEIYDAIINDLKFELMFALLAVIFKIISMIRILIKK